VLDDGQRLGDMLVDPGVLLGSVRALHRLPDGVDAVVSLCRLGTPETPHSVRTRDHVEVWLIDAGPVENPHLSFDIDDAARAVAALQAEGRTVLLHFVDAKSRTPIVAARYSVLRHGADPVGALDEVVRALPETDVNEELRVHHLRLGSNVVRPNRVDGRHRLRRCPPGEPAIARRCCQRRVKWLTSPPAWPGRRFGGEIHFKVS
jgi:ADP-ribosyl-[dinitrogen reductase] hydrolase